METVTRYLLRKGKLEKIEVPKEKAIKEIEEVLEEDKEFLEIMETM